MIDDTASGVSLSLLLELKPPGRPGGGNRMQIRDMRVAICSELFERWYGSVDNLRTAVREIQAAGMKGVKSPAALTTHASMAARHAQDKSEKGEQQQKEQQQLGGGAAAAAGRKHPHAAGQAEAHKAPHPSQRPVGGDARHQQRDGAPGGGEAPSTSGNGVAEGAGERRKLSIRAHVLSSHTAAGPGYGSSVIAGGGASPKRANGQPLSHRTPRHAPGVGVHIGAPHVGSGIGNGNASSPTSSLHASPPAAAVVGQPLSPRSAEPAPRLSHHGSFHAPSGVAHQSSRSKLTERRAHSFPARAEEPSSPTAAHGHSGHSSHSGHSGNSLHSPSPPSNHTINPQAPPPVIRTFVYRGALRMRGLFRGAQTPAAAAAAASPGRRPLRNEKLPALVPGRAARTAEAAATPLVRSGSHKRLGVEFAATTAAT